MTVQHAGGDLSRLRALPRREPNPCAMQAEAMIRAECDALGLMLPGQALYTTMTAYLFPHAPTVRLVPMGLLNDIMFYIDDRHSLNRADLDETMAPGVLRDLQACAGALRGLARSGSSEIPDAEAITAGFARVRELLAPLAPPRLLERVASAVDECIAGMAPPVREILIEDIPDLGRYIKMRDADAGMRLEVEFADFARGFVLDDDAVRSPALSRLRRRVTTIGGLMNDLFSYEKEVVRHGQIFNLVPVLQRSRHLAPQAAFAEAVALVNALTEEIEQLAQTTNESADETIRSYIEALRDQVSASYHWQAHTARYAHRR